MSRRDEDLLPTPALGKKTMMDWDVHSSPLICFISVPGTKNSALAHQQTVNLFLSYLLHKYTLFMSN